MSEFWQLNEFWQRVWGRVAPPDLDVPAIFSMAALRHAWLQVKRNKGAAGVDNQSVAAFERNLDEHLRDLQAALIAGTYKPQAVRRIYIPKANGEPRPLSIWTVRDRVAQRVIFEYAEPLWEPIFLPCSYGFRPGRSTADAVRQIVAYGKDDLRWVVDGDIKSCFDEIDSRLLMTFVRRRLFHQQVLQAIEGFLHASVFNTINGKPEKAGVSQGNVLAPLLCNIFLHEFDTALTAQGYALVRYADDWVIITRRKAEAQTALQVAQQVLGRLRLRVNPHKTALKDIQNEGIHFLGYAIKGQWTVPPLPPVS